MCVPLCATVCHCVYVCVYVCVCVCVRLYVWMRAPVREQMPLQRGHAELVRRQCVGEGVCEKVLRREEPQEQLVHLVLGRETHLNAHVTPTGPDERRVQSLDVVGGHEDETALLRQCVRATDKRVRQSLEGQ